MTEDQRQLARARAEVVQKALDGAKFKMLELAEQLVTSGSMNLNPLQHQRERIELLEYALKCAPPKPVARPNVSFG
ncbi:hypothetical protein OB03_14235 [Brevundimonas sp. GN22]